LGVVVSVLSGEQLRKQLVMKPTFQRTLTNENCQHSSDDELVDHR